MEKDSLFWADRITHEVKERVSASAVLQKVVKEKGYICYDEKTPSGKIHIGSGRGWIIHDTVAKAMASLGLKARFILSSDDMDPFDAIPADLDKKKYLPYMGAPMKNVPSPDENYESYADYYFKQCTEKFPDFGISAELEHTSTHYENGDFNKCIKLALDNADKIQKIYENLYGKVKAAEKLPFNPICEKCGKIGTTFAYQWDKEHGILKYLCEPEMVDWATGCGFKGEISPYNGNGKFPWKVEWAAKWPTIGVVFEVAGKDHFTKGGSRDAAIRICSQVFNYPPPYPSTSTEIGQGYEFFTIGGKKMSTSKGLGAGFREISEKLSPKILRYLLVRTRPRAVIDFDPFGTNKLVLLYDNYDRAERIYFGTEKLQSEKEAAQEKRIYEFSYVGKIPKKAPPQFSLSSAAIVLQTTNFNTEKAMAILQKLGKIPKEPSAAEKAYVLERLKDSIIFVKEFAPNEYKFTIIEKVSDTIKASLSKAQKEALQGLAKELEKDSAQEALEQKLYDIAKAHNLKPNEFFSAAYSVLIGKERGPRLAAFLLSLDKNFVIKRFENL